jgi:hypothetical protein
VRPPSTELRPLHAGRRHRQPRPRHWPLARASETAWTCCAASSLRPLRRPRVACAAGVGHHHQERPRRVNVGLAVRGTVAACAYTAVQECRRPRCNFLRVTSVARCPRGEPPFLLRRCSTAGPPFFG